MSYYYVTHPNMDFSATVKAPSTDKARTTFLDYLERSGKALRKDRQLIRRNTVADRIEFPEEVDTDVSLSYNYTGENGIEEEQVIQVGYGQALVGEEPIEDEDYDRDTVEDTFGLEPEPELEPEPMPIEQVEREQDIKDTPIGRMSLGSV